MMSRLPTFKSLEEERRFWETHDAFEVLGEDGWEIAEGTEVDSVYVAPVGDRGAVMYVPIALLNRIGVEKGGRVKAWTEGDRLIVEAVE